MKFLNNVEINGTLTVGGANIWEHIVSLGNGIAQNGGDIQSHYTYFNERINNNYNTLYGYISNNSSNISGLTTRVNNLELKSVRYKDYTLSQVPITTKSAYGAYYFQGVTATSISSDIRTILSVTITNWNHAIASFAPYIQNNSIMFMSDVSQTIATITIRVTYLI